MFVPVHGLRHDGDPVVGPTVRWWAPHDEVRECTAPVPGLDHGSELMA